MYVTRYVDQGGGKRKGAFAMYLEPWHADVFDFIELRKNHGKEEVGHLHDLVECAAAFSPCALAASPSRHPTSKAFLHLGCTAGWCWLKAAGCTSMAPMQANSCCEHAGTGARPLLCPLDQ